MGWPATVSLRNYFIHPVVFSGLALQSNTIFNFQPPHSKDPLACWPAQCWDLFLRPSPCWWRMPTHSHPRCVGNRSPFSAEPLGAPSTGARGGHPKAGGPRSASDRAFSGVGDSCVTAGGSSRAVSRSCGAPVARRHPLPRRRHPNPAFPSSILW